MWFSYLCQIIQKTKSSLSQNFTRDHWLHTPCLASNEQFQDCILWLLVPNEHWADESCVFCSWQSASLRSYQKRSLQWSWHSSGQLKKFGRTDLVIDRRTKVSEANSKRYLSFFTRTALTIEMNGANKSKVILQLS